ncbi:MAG TPA: hypothetical protein VJ784_21800 [Pyrinomonadaceae bacterium]|jgi:hypothetical protein|nr:hypothetical protein [Pyrinomonadaceae bacterium]
MEDKKMKNQRIPAGEKNNISEKQCVFEPPASVDAISRFANSVAITSLPAKGGG